MFTNCIALIGVIPTKDLQMEMEVMKREEGSVQTGFAGPSLGLGELF